MRHSLRLYLHWTPRVLGVLFALFVSIFAGDVIGQGYGFWGTLAALLVHLVPVYLLLIALAVAWRAPLAGTATFVVLAVGYIATMWGRFPLAANLVGVLPIAGPLLLLALLFLLDWLTRPKQPVTP